jgi:ubiquinone/menaquinone biosynthesis C-methylase UbiE
MYNGCAPSYDAFTGGWHVQLGLDFVERIAPALGASVLDLACGTGVVTIPAAEAVGSSGTVIGIDITPGMLREARNKTPDEGCAKIEWIECDVASLNEVEAVQSVIRQNCGFDVISCCSAFVLLMDPATTIVSWASLPKSGGK